MGLAPTPPNQARRDQRGQATAEFALIVPLVVTLALCSVQLGLVARDAVLLSHAAQVAARSLHIGAPAGQTATDVTADVLAQTPLAADRLHVSVARSGRFVDLTLTYRSATDVPLVGQLLRDVTLTERLSVLASEVP